MQHQQSAYGINKAQKKLKGKVSISPVITSTWYFL